VKVIVFDPDDKESVCKTLVFLLHIIHLLFTPYVIASNRVFKL